MASKFLNLEEDDLGADQEVKIGSSLKNKKTKPHPKSDPSAVAAAGQANGFNRTTTPIPAKSTPRRGRPPLNEDMTYWRIYVSAGLREELNDLRDQEGRRLNDLLADMLTAYRNRTS